MHPARRLWQLYESYHAITYFAPELPAAYEVIGLRGFWRGYFAGRAAPLGPVGAGLVTAAFFGFAPLFVARAVPSVWTIASPDDALGARLAGMDAALRRLLGPELESPAISEAAQLARSAIEACEPAGRPLFAANAALEWPSQPHLQLWHATTLLREHRGDGHVSVLVAAGVGPCEAHVTQIAWNGTPPESIQPYRGWDERDWAAAAERLRARGWLEGDRLTEQGHAGRGAIEEATDELAREPVDRLGSDGYEHLVAALSSVVGVLGQTGVIPYPNPIGVSRPDA